MRLKALLPLLGTVLIGLLLASCASVPSPAERRAQADALAAAQGWQALDLPAEVFRLRAYLPARIAPDAELTLYIEGDGFAWVTPSRPSFDPTPRTPVALQMALAQPGGNAAYLGRPCQYVGVEPGGCDRRYWTDARFAPEVVAAMDVAVDRLKARFGARRLVLVGYSGGGAVATLLAARRRDVTLLITVAGNLDHRAWAKLHRLSPLSASLNPADWRSSLAGVRQWHLAGAVDRVIPPAISHDFVAGLPRQSRAEVRVMPGYDHQCCWAQDWAELCLVLMRPQ